MSEPTAYTLEQLRGLHAPAPISAWPPAPGWIIVFALLLLMASIAGWIVYRQWRKNRRRRQALAQLQQLKQQLSQRTLSPQDLMAELSVLLKRSSLSVFPHETVAGLQGDAWLAFLDNSGQTRDFSQGVGRLLISAPYQSTSVVIPDDLFSVIQAWIIRVL